MKNSGSAPLGFYHVQNVTVTVTKSFIEYLKTQPIMFKIFGHYNNHPLHNDAKQDYTRPPPRRLQPPSIPISQPVRSPKFGPLPVTPSSTILAKHDVLVWFEICELAPNGEYVPAVVEHSDELPCRGLFLLHQGIQRRIRITIVHEPTSEIKWKEIRELVVGRIRNNPESSDDLDDDSCVLSLGLFPGEVVEVPGDDRSFFRFEAAWDSSLHNSILLNRVSQNGETIYITLSAYLEVRGNLIGRETKVNEIDSLSARKLHETGDYHQGLEHDHLRARCAHWTPFAEASVLGLIQKSRGEPFVGHLRTLITSCF